VILRISLLISTASRALQQVVLEHGFKRKKIPLFKQMSRSLLRKRGDKSTFGVKVELRRNQSFKALQRETRPFRVVLALHQDDPNVIFGYSPKLMAGVRHRRNARGMKVDKQNLYVAAAERLFPSIARQVRTS
jgi:hypothetical protein